jgi:hypothetical protein
MKASFMDVDTAKKVKELIGSWKTGQLKYETKKSIKGGFASVEDYVANKLNPVIEQSQTEDENQDFSWKKTDAEGNPFFDVKKVYNSKNSKPNKAMFEWFLLDIGSKEPSSFSTADMNEMWKSLQYFRDNHPTVLNKKYNGAIANEWFRELQHLIKNDKMFWVLFTDFYVNDERSLNKEELEKPNRLSVPQSQRIEEHHRQWDYPSSGNTWGGLNLQSQIERLNEYEDDDYVTVYRSFSVQAKYRDETGKLVRGKAVRKGITKLSDESGIHMEGNGYSYSFSKFATMRYASNINTDIIKKNCNVTDTRARTILSKWIEPKMIDYVEMYGGFYRAIGQFKIKKKDILICTDSRCEDEVIANPKDVILEDYKFLGTFHYVAMQTVATFLNGAAAQKNIKTTQIINTDDAYDFCYEIVRQISKKSPDAIGNFLSLKPKSGKKWYDLVYETMKDYLNPDEGTHELGLVPVGKNERAIVFYGNLVQQRKKTVTLYQPRSFQSKSIIKKHEPSKIETLSPQKQQLNVLAENQKQKTWFNPNQ